MESRSCKVINLNDYEKFHISCKDMKCLKIIEIQNVKILIN